MRKRLIFLTAVILLLLVPLAVGATSEGPIRAFDDVSGNKYEDWIMSFADQEYTVGYDSVSYGPSDISKRSQFAIWALRVKHGPSYMPPAADGSCDYTDIGGHWAEDWIEQACDEGIVSNGPLYNPNNNVNRAQAAVFLLRVVHGPTWTPPVVIIPQCYDLVEARWYTNWANNAVLEGWMDCQAGFLFNAYAGVTRAEASRHWLLVAHDDSDYLPPAFPKKGLARTYGGQFPDDLTDLGAEWYFNWGATESLYTGPYGDYVPMSYSGQEIAWLDSSFDGYLLVFNEPENGPPYGGGQGAVDAAIAYCALASAYPKATLVVGGVQVWHYSYFSDLVDEIGARCELPRVWHAHMYVDINASFYDVYDNFDDLDVFHNLVGGTWWITEWADTTSNDPAITQTFLEEFEDRIWVQKIAIETNRFSGAEPWCPPNWEIYTPLMGTYPDNWDADTIREKGIFYRDYVMPEWE